MSRSSRSLPPTAAARSRERAAPWRPTSRAPCGHVLCFETKEATAARMPILCESKRTLFLNVAVCRLASRWPFVSTDRGGAAGTGAAGSATADSVRFAAPCCSSPLLRAAVCTCGCALCTRGMYVVVLQYCCCYVLVRRAAPERRAGDGSVLPPCRVLRSVFVQCTLCRKERDATMGHAQQSNNQRNFQLSFHQLLTV